MLQATPLAKLTSVLLPQLFMQLRVQNKNHRLCLSGDICLQLGLSQDNSDSENWRCSTAFL